MVFFCNIADAPVHELFNLSVVPPTLLASERKEAKSVLTLFLMQQGLSKAVAARTITKSNHFIEHLVSRLYSAHKSGYLVGPVAACTFFFNPIILVSLVLC